MLGIFVYLFIISHSEEGLNDIWTDFRSEISVQGLVENTIRKLSESFMNIVFCVQNNHKSPGRLVW